MTACYRRISLTTFLLLLSVSAFASPDGQLVVDEVSEFEQWELDGLEPLVDEVSIGASLPRSRHIVSLRGNSYLRTLEFSAHGRDFIAQLERTPVVGPECEAIIHYEDRIETIDCPSSVFAGHLSGDPNSFVAAVFDGPRVTANISSEAGEFYVRPASYSQPGAEAALHRVEYLPAAFGPLSADRPGSPAAFSTPAVVAGRLAIAPVVMISDAVATAQIGNSLAALNEVITIAVGASFLLAPQINVRFQVSQVQVWVVDPSEFSPTNSISARAEQLKSWKTKPSNPLKNAPFVYQVTGQPTGSGRGACFAETFCSQNGAGVGKRQGGALARADYTILAHEFGHCAGQCAHDGQSDCGIFGHEQECLVPNCSAPSGGCVMQQSPSVLTPPTVFSQCSIDEIGEFLTSGSGGAGCLSRAVCGDYVPSDGQTAITAQDVLAALRMAVAGPLGIAPHPIVDVASPFGTITATDALVLINVVVGRLPVPLRCGA